MSTLENHRPTSPDPWHRAWDLPRSVSAEPATTGPQENPLRQLTLTGYTPETITQVYGRDYEGLSERERATLKASSLAIRKAAETTGIGLDGQPAAIRRRR